MREKAAADTALQFDLERVLLPLALNPGLTTPVMPKLLENKMPRGKVQVVGENGPADGLIISKRDGKMYIVSVIQPTSRMTSGKGFARSCPSRPSVDASPRPICARSRTPSAT